MPSEFPSLTQYASPAKEFLTKREKLWTWVVMVTVGLLLLKGLSVAMPTISNFLGQAIAAVGKLFVLISMLGAGLLALKILTSEKFKTWVWYIQTSIGRSVDDYLVRSDPIGKMQAFAEDFLNAQLQKVIRGYQFVEGKLGEVKARKAEKEESAANHMATAKALRDRYFKDGKWVEMSRDQQARGGRLRMTWEAQFNLESQQYELDIALVKKLAEKAERMEQYCETLAKLQHAFDFWIQGVQAMVEFMKVDYESSKAEVEVAEVVASTRRGSPKADIFKKAVDFTRSEISRMSAQVQTVLSVTPELMSYEIAGEVAADRMTARLSGLNEAADQIVASAQAQHSRLTSGSLLKDIENGRELVPAAVSRATLTGGERAQALPAAQQDSEPTSRRRSLLDRGRRRPPSSN